ncbi:MAG: hypothetical protein AAGI38_02760 [Bacteroidota bacterium]
MRYLYLMTTTLLCLIFHSSNAQNVGVGTNNPQERLHVRGNTRVSTLAGNNRLVYGDNNGTLRLVGTGTAGQVLTSTGAGVPIWTTPIGGEWLLTGNAGTSPATNFLGTTDSLDLIFRTHNQERIRTFANGNVSIDRAGTSNNRLYINQDDPTGFYSARFDQTSANNGTKGGLYNYVANTGTGARYGLYNYIYQNANSNAIFYGQYNYLPAYGLGTKYGTRTQMFLSGTNASPAYESYAYLTAYGTGERYGRFLDMYSTNTATGENYGTYHRIRGTGAGAKHGLYNSMESNAGANYGVFNDMVATGTGVQAGIYTTYPNTNTHTGTQYGAYNYIFGSGATGVTYGVRNYVARASNSTQYGTSNYISNAGNGTKYGSYNYVSSAGTGVHYGVYASAYGDNNRAVYATNSDTAGWAGYFYGRTYVRERLGVGIAKPEKRFHVRDNSNSTDASAVIENINTGIDADVTLNLRTNRSGTRVNYALGINNSMARDLQLCESNWVGSNIRMMVDEVTGYVMIGNSGYYRTGTDGATSPTERLDVRGNLDATGTKNFIIDHPDDPYNKILRHFCIESNEGMVMYRGKITLDANGEANVSLPDYFPGLTDETNATVILTPIGRQPFLTSYELNTDNTFSVYGDPNREVSYQVSAERDDKSYQYYKRPVEQDKDPSFTPKGYLLSPEAYGITPEPQMIDPAPKPGGSMLPPDKTLPNEAEIEAEASEQEKAYQLRIQRQQQERKLQEAQDKLEEKARSIMEQQASAQH